MRKLIAQGITTPRKGSDKGDHPPITPMRGASEAELGSEGWRIYSLVTQNFIATLSPDCSYEKVGYINLLIRHFKSKSFRQINSLAN